jgi:predicted transcriptional regulator
MSDAEKNTLPAKSRLFGMQIPNELDDQLTEVSRRHCLTKSGIARMALERGLTVLTAQLETGAADQ